jgi:hypothetical protein
MSWLPQREVGALREERSSLQQLVESTEAERQQLQASVENLSRSVRIGTACCGAMLRPRACHSACQPRAAPPPASHRRNSPAPRRLKEAQGDDLQHKLRTAQRARAASDERCTELAAQVDHSLVKLATQVKKIAELERELR